MIYSIVKFWECVPHKHYYISSLVFLLQPNAKIVPTNSPCDWMKHCHYKLLENHIGDLIRLLGPYMLGNHKCYEEILQTKYISIRKVGRIGNDNKHLGRKYIPIISPKDIVLIYYSGSDP